MKQFHRTGQHQRQEQGKRDRDECDVPDIEKQADRTRDEDAHRGDPAGRRAGLAMRLDLAVYLDGCRRGGGPAAACLGPNAILFFSRPGKHVLLDVLATVVQPFLCGEAPLNRSTAQQASVGRGRPSASTARRWSLVHNAHMQTGKPQGGAVRLANVARRSLTSWLKDGAPGMGAAISFYSLFAIGPILLMVIWVAGAFVGPEAVKAHVLEQMRELLGDTGSEAVAALLMSVGYATRGGYATVAGILTLLISATGMFAELQNALRRIWSSPPRGTRENLWQLLRTRLLSFGFLLVVGFLLLVSLTAGAVLEAFGAWMG